LFAAEIRRGDPPSSDYGATRGGINEGVRMRIIENGKW